VTEAPIYPLEVEWVAREAITGEGVAPSVLLLGEGNPYFSGHEDPSYSLYCYPIGSAGYRLRRILGLPQHQYLGLHRANLCDGTWSKPRAKERASALLVPLAPWRVIVMLGRKVTEAMCSAAMIDGDIVPFSTRKCCPGITLVSFPHPSGRNAALWNAKARERARQMLRELAPEVSWGSIDAEEAAS
jgi:hypothetical protein